MKTILFFCLLSIGVLSIACKRYPKDAFTTLRSPKSRLVGGWSIVDITKNNVSLLSGNQIYFKQGELNLFFTNNGSVGVRFMFNSDDYFSPALYKYDPIKGIVFPHGEWSLGEKNSILNISIVDTLGLSYNYKWKILRLQSKHCYIQGGKYTKSLIFSETKGSDTYQFLFNEIHEEQCK